MKRLMLSLFFTLLLLFPLGSAERGIYGDTTGYGLYGFYNLTYVNATQFCINNSNLICIDSWDDINGSGSGTADGFWNITGSKYLYNNSGVLDVNESALNATTESYGYITSADDNVSGSELETLFSTTIGLLYRAGVATYQSVALGSHFQVSGGIFSLITGSIKAADLNLTDITVGTFSNDRAYLNSSNTSTVQGMVNNSDINIAGNAATATSATTATALAANGANCAAGNYPLGVDASGAVENCTAINGSALSVSSIYIENAPVECNINNTFMTYFEGNQSTCREINQSLINTASLNNDAGFITTDTNANTLCSGTTTYLDGEGNCDDISGVYQPAGSYYAVGGTDVALADGGTGASLTDPNADRILFWDDSAGAVAFLTASTGLTISTTSMTVRAASTSQTGIAETATNAEVTNGTDALRYITPSSLTSITKLGTITTGTWNATTIKDAYIASAATWNAKYGNGDSPTFATVDTGQGANELYDMDQNVLTTSDVEFNTTNSTLYYIGATGCIRVSGSQIIIDGDGSGC